MEYIQLSKNAPTSPVLTLVRGDASTQVLQLRVDRKYGGVDLSNLSWAVKVIAPDGTTDAVPLGIAERVGNNLCLHWTLKALEAAAVGVTHFLAMGVEGEATVWQSGTYGIEVVADIDAEPSVSEDALTEFQQIIRDLPTVYDARDGANAAADGANESAAAADVAAGMANTAAYAANEAAYKAETAEREIRSAAARGDFNGKDGAQGIQGVQGVPGKDGKDGAPGAQGIQGEPGRDGADGKDGAPGAKGDPFTYDDFTSEQLAALKGEPGKDGRDGVDGKDGAPGKDGSDAAVTEENVKAALGMNTADQVATKRDLTQLKNTGDNPSPAGKVWTTTDSGAGWDYPQEIVDIKPDQIYGSEPVDESGKDLDITGERKDGFYVNTNNGGDAPYNGLSVGIALIEAGKTYLVTLWNAPPNNVVGFYTTGLTEGNAGYLGKDYASAVDFDLVDQANKVYSFVAPDGAVRINYTYWTAEGGFIKEIGTKPDLYKLPWLKVYESNLSEQLKSKLNTDDVYKYGDSILKPFHFNGKLAVSFGDSITFGITSPGLVYSYSPYIKQFADHVGMSLDNKAVSGSTIAKKSGFSCVSDKIDEYNGDADFVIIAGGTNDYQLQTDLGFFGDGSTDTFYGALEHICSVIERKAPNATVIFITPVNRTTYVNGQYTLNDYRNAIYEVATKHKYNVVDGSSVGFPSEIGDWANTMIDNADGVHPTTLGHYQYFKGLCEKLC